LQLVGPVEEITIHLGDDVLERVNSLASQQNITLNQLVGRLLREALQVKRLSDGTLGERAPGLTGGPTEAAGE
jgi:hypothetical protein